MPNYSREIQKLVEGLRTEMESQARELKGKKITPVNEKKRDVFFGKAEQTAEFTATSSASILDDSLDRMNKRLDVLNKELAAENIKTLADIRKAKSKPLTVNDVCQELRRFVQEIVQLNGPVHKLRQGSQLAKGDKNNEAMKEAIKQVEDKLTEFKAYMSVVLRDCANSKDAKFIANEKSDIVKMVKSYERIFQSHERQNRIAGHFKLLRKVAPTAGEEDATSSNIKSPRK